MDRAAVRFSVIILNAYILVSSFLAYNGIDISVLDYIFSCPMLFGLVLSVLCLRQGRYHCRWMRLLCCNLVIIPAMSLADGMFPVFETAEQYVYAIAGVTALNTAVTMALGIIHFLRVRKVKKRNRYERIRSVNRCHQGTG